MSIWFDQLICTFSCLSMLSQLNKTMCCCIKHLQELFLYNGSVILLPRRIPLHKMLLRRTSPS
uniref:Putative ovule protein n=1 Tax=Solanum chacoense TaxID=4108 RepID=A0A0V0GJU6_SOLCH